MMSLTILALVAFRTITQIRSLSKRWQVPNDHPIILTVQLGDLLSAFAATSPNFCAFNCDDNFAAFIHCRLQYFDFRDTQRDGDVFFSHGLILIVLPNFSPFSYPRYLGAITATVKEPAHIKANHPVSYADAFVGVAALKLNGIVMTGDLEFNDITELTKVE